MSFLFTESRTSSWTTSCFNIDIPGEQPAESVSITWPTGAFHLRNAFEKNLFGRLKVTWLFSMSSSGHKCRPIRTVQGYPSHVTSGIFRTHLIRHTLVRTKVCTPLLSPEDVQISVVQTSVFSYYRNLIFRYSMALTVYFHLVPWPFSSAFGLHLVWTKGVRASQGRVALGTTHQMSEFRWIFRTHTSL